MAEYIDREAANLALAEQGFDWDKAKQALASVPTADVVPVVRGRWGTGRFNLETGNYEEQCTRCRNFSTEYGKPYCPNCGAKMDRGVDND
jgi:PHP family Zn ribbon phosphoesterase